MAAHGFTYYSVGRAASHPEAAPAALNTEMKNAEMKKAAVKNGANQA
jgi:hypothetical protein